MSDWLCETLGLRKLPRLALHGSEVDPEAHSHEV
jgi:hypothetical protein